MEFFSFCSYPQAQRIKLITLKPGVFIFFADTGLVSPIQTCSFNPDGSPLLYGVFLCLLRLLRSQRGSRTISTRKCRGKSKQGTELSKKQGVSFIWLIT